MKEKFFGVFGNPIAHSKSPLLHNKAFGDFEKELGFRGHYQAILLEEGSSLKATFLALNLSGANITAPFKEDAYHLSDVQEGQAQAIQALNTWVYEKGRIVGRTTDIEGFYAPLKERNFKPQKVLVLGAGGSARAVVAGLCAQGVEVHVFNRSSQRLETFYAQGLTCFHPPHFPLESYDLLVNTTSAGMDGATYPLDLDILKSLLAKAHMAYDLIYSVQTPFLRLAKDIGAEVLDGRAMFIAQAALSFGYFCAQKIPYAEILKSMQEVF
ncbi:shikimate dehydrogenase [Helicobacter felis]|uniref:Shikimate dehydrogenase (NADP(+)) n=1 Tax=Helicobacter felis (strain ATCC 49179 / CCUG 28539 / NCTC 12436 / CS1) TaxID=936155 RepID=E7ACY1_HELFC|nr:shikimate dehydrogenase [Helicobacter felis]CBY83099.1 shikimate 5-dehydrogenase [Helicobacter felis ATCC 49179]